MLQYEKIGISEEIDTNKISLSKECMLFHCVGILKMADLDLNHIFAINVMMF